MRRVQDGHTNRPISASTALRRSNPADRRSGDRRTCWRRPQVVDERGLRRQHRVAGRLDLRYEHAQREHRGSHRATRCAVAAVLVLLLVRARRAYLAAIGRGIGAHGHARDALGRRVHVAPFHSTGHSTGACRPHALKNQGKGQQGVEENFAHGTFRLPEWTGISRKSSRTAKERQAFSARFSSGV